MVIRLDAKPVSAATTSAAVPQQQKYTAPTAQVPESRDHIPLDDVAVGNQSHVMGTVSKTSTVTTLSTQTAGKSSSSSSQSVLQKDNEFVRTAINIEGSKRTNKQPAAAPSALTDTPVVPPSSRQRFVKKAAGAREIELRHASPSGSLSSDSSTGKGSLSSGISPRRSDVQSGGIEGRNEDLPSVAATSANSGSSADIASDNSASANVSSSIANRIAMLSLIHI